ncbi:MAG: riboflavin biosynthesis protein RibF [Victivallaceae bacterium]
MSVSQESKAIIDVPSLDALAERGIKTACLAIGVFDGVHKGHQLLIKALLEMSVKHHSVPVALTFFPHPREVVQPDNPPPLLVPPAKKIELLHQYGIKAVVTIPFSREFAAQTPDEFIKNCLNSSRVKIRGICVGCKWRFGAGGTGDSSVLRDFADRGHFDFEAVDELTIGDSIVSSTAIRRAVSSGLLERAQELLGRPYSLCGIVEKGHHVAGPELAHPTANLKITYGILPPDGVYAASVILDGKRYPAAVNAGVSPTYNRPEDRSKRFEVHIIGFEQNIYGAAVEVELLKYLREERSFPDSAMLKQQIIKDIEDIKLITTNNKHN